MDGYEDTPHSVKRVTLPSGKTIEVVYFKDAAEDEPAPPIVESEQELHRCAACASALVYPTTWEEAGDETWWVALRCPDCEHRREGVFSQTTVEAFDAELDAGTDILTSDLRRLTRANMAEAIERFVAALAADAVLPEDFCA